MKKISQRQARYYRKEVLRLEGILANQRTLNDVSFAKLTTARLLGHAVVVIPNGSGTQAMLYAEKL